MISIDIIIKSLYLGVLGREISDAELEARLNSNQIKMSEVEYFLSMVIELIGSEEFRTNYGLHSNFFDVQRPDVYYAYKFLLGRVPEGDAIYREKKNLKDVEELLATLIRSEEFMGNLILKDIVSVRRKPAGFMLGAEGCALEGKKRIIVLSGCQGKQIADYLQIKTGVNSVPNLYLGNKELADFVKMQAASYREKLAEYDLIYTQKKDVVEVLGLYPELASKVRIIPIIEYAGFQPDQVYVLDAESGKFVIGPLGEYQSLIVIASFYGGYSIEQCAGFFCSDVYEKMGFGQLRNDSLECLRSIGHDMGYPMDNLLAKWNKNGRWMRTINHPFKQVIGDLVDEALLKEGIAPEQDIDAYVIDHLASNVDWPQYPNSPEEEALVKTRFKLPSALSAKSNVARFLDLEGFITATYHSLNGINVTSLRFNQLGRNVDIHAAIDVLAGVVNKQTP